MKIVREHINERMGFTEDSDPINDMGIGKIDIIKYIQDLKIEDKNDIRVHEFLSSLIYKTISGEFRRGHGDWAQAGRSNYTFVITRNTIGRFSETLEFEDDHGFSYLVLWGEKYHIS